MIDRRLIVILGLVISTFACKSSDDSSDENPGGDIPIMCDNRGIDSRCYDYWLGAFKDQVADTCKGTIVAGTCTKTNAVGACEVLGVSGPTQGKVIRGVYYNDGPKAWTLDDAKGDCVAQSGSFLLP